MKRNSPEDTEWLALESEEFLMTAIIWPNNMVKIFNVIGFLCLTLFSYGLTISAYPLVIACLVVLVGIAYKLHIYYKDIVLINNELNRRDRE